MSDLELLALVRQGQRYHIAARQDADPVIRHVHLNYAVTHYELAHHGATRQRIRRVSGADIDLLLAGARREQDRVQRQLIAQQGGVVTV